MVKELCPKCLGKGWTGTVKHSQRKYKEICTKCYGKKYLDWIEMITGVYLKTYLLTAAQIIHRNLPIDDYILKYNYILRDDVVTYCIEKEFFNTNNTFQDACNHFEFICINT